MDLVIFLPLLIIMGAFMYFASRRQKKAMQATIDLHNSLEIGDQIHTTSGLQGTITGIGDDYVELEIAPGRRHDVDEAGGAGPRRRRRRRIRG